MCEYGNAHSIAWTTPRLISSSPTSTEISYLKRLVDDCLSEIVNLLDIASLAQVSLIGDQNLWQRISRMMKRTHYDLALDNYGLKVPILLMNPFPLLSGLQQLSTIDIRQIELTTSLRYHFEVAKTSPLLLLPPTIEKMTFQFRSSVLVHTKVDHQHHYHNWMRIDWKKSFPILKTLKIAFHLDGEASTSFLYSKAFSSDVDLEWTSTLPESIVTLSLINCLFDSRTFYTRLAVSKEDWNSHVETRLKKLDSDEIPDYAYPVPNLRILELSKPLPFQIPKPSTIRPSIVCMLWNDGDIFAESLPYRTEETNLSTIPSSEADGHVTESKSVLSSFNAVLLTSHPYVTVPNTYKMPSLRDIGNVISFQWQSVPIGRPDLASTLKLSSLLHLSVRDIDISENMFNALSSGLKTLHISKFKVASLVVFLKRCTSLTSLSTGNTVISPEVASALPSTTLKTLNTRIRLSEFENLPSDLLWFPNSLTHLELTIVGLDESEFNFYNFLPGSLETLILETSPLLHLSSKQFRSLPQNLKRFIIMKPGPIEWPEKVGSYLPRSLTRLHLPGSVIVKEEGGVISKLTSWVTGNHLKPSKNFMAKLSHVMALFPPNCICSVSFSLNKSTDISIAYLQEIAKMFYFTSPFV